MPSNGRRRDLVRVVLWMTGALLSFSAMAVSIRALAGTLRIMEILAIRDTEWASHWVEQGLESR